MPTPKQVIDTLKKSRYFWQSNGRRQSIHKSSSHTTRQVPMAQ
jgi:hypothetical protein